MYQVFNCGHRIGNYMLIRKIGTEIFIAISKSFNVNAQIVGRVEASENKEINNKISLRNV